MMEIPKFHDRKSLYIGVGAGGLLVLESIISMIQDFHWARLYQLAVGLVLCVHCIDMVKYYKSHRIVKIVKTENERLVYKEKNKVKVWWNGLYFAWQQPVLKIWIAICTIGILIGLLSGIGMMQLVLLVAIACIGWGMEVANSAIELLLDIVHPEYSDKVKIVKNAFASVPCFIYSAYVISWLILVIPRLCG
jgi:diacylglycerol kinase